ncbi:hypothetical protein D0C36_02310 [Mucilaginibacter conchicola]|uniref:Collagen-like protein n=1 Tax=Mucilaginibacter conchicola TaxID=2303333 RepID=A0A372NWC3_9SPHI|nr:hypothetical protein [Mucilaginibacter conchicola]RFZ94406.1 hypothetical protein D0C36_02310 [Mucilaginibacter conchicola]
METIKTFTKKLLLLFIAVTMLAACKKGDEGPQGEKGDKGDDGAKGATGAAGAKGATGATGTANVLYSDWVYAKNFRDSIIDNSNMHVADINAPALTTEVLSNASINVYFTYGGGVFPLPHTTYAGNKTSMINFAPRFKHFNITRFTLDNSNSVNLSTVLQYRYVIIPGGKKLAAAKKVNMNDYQEVKRTYNIPN